MKRILCLMIVLSPAACQWEDPQVKVFKFDGSLQCEGPGVAPEEMAQELIGAGIEVSCWQKGNDGRARIAMCGAPTGSINVFTISEASRADAESLGFTSVEALPDYRDEPCK